MGLNSWIEWVQIHGLSGSELMDQVGQNSWIEWDRIHGLNGSEFMDQAEVLWSLMHLHGLALVSNVAGQHFWHFWLIQPVFSHNKSWQTWLSIFYLIQTPSYTSQERFICRSAMLADASRFSCNVAEQHFWLLQPVLSHSKSWKTWLSIFYLI